MNADKIADEVISIVVISAATVCACYLTYKSGEVPEFFTTMAGMIAVYYYGMKNGSRT